MGYRLAATPLLPVLYMQGRRMRRVVPRLPEPPGAREGANTGAARGEPGCPPPLRLLVLGDSAAAGVGAASQDDALLGRLVAELASSGPVAWRLVARTGATSASTRRHLAGHPPAPGEGYDVAVVSLGLNDVVAGRPTDAVLTDLSAVVEALGRDWGVGHVVLTAPPPVERFPAVPQPLRWYLGRRARALNAALGAWADGRRASAPTCEVLRLDAADVALGPGGFAAAMASDGFHPGPTLYAAWGRAAAARVQAWRDDRAAPSARVAER